MPFTLQNLINAGLPATSTDGNDIQAKTQFSRELTPTEWQTYLTIADPDKAKKLQAILDAANLGNWWTWTQTQFSTWCDDNLMTNAAIDASALSAELKINVKAINLFVRNAGKLLVAMRDIIKWIVKQVL
jgi:hypothetical protein